MGEEEQNPPTDLPGRTEEGFRGFRKEERKQMIDTLHDLIEESGKRARSQYTPSKERVRWVKLTGQLIWYKDHVLRNYDFERLAIEIEELKQRLDEDDKKPKGPNVFFIPQQSQDKTQQEPMQENKPRSKQFEMAEEREAGLYGESE